MAIMVLRVWLYCQLLDERGRCCRVASSFAGLQKSASLSTSPHQQSNIAQFHSLYLLGLCGLVDSLRLSAAPRGPHGWTGLRPRGIQHREYDILLVCLFSGLYWYPLLDIPVRLLGCLSKQNATRERKDPTPFFFLHASGSGLCHHVASHHHLNLRDWRTRRMAELRGWLVESSAGHCVGSVLFDQIRCPQGRRERPAVSITRGLFRDGRRHVVRLYSTQYSSVLFRRVHSVQSSARCL
mmetsp:Transcript_10686/g.15730  ORF Transcript_10686/g.15730 Transcript_10686/m.15730 type:complete len:239 (+) Transcript_10686:444-1160(+)